MNKYQISILKFTSSIREKGFFHLFSANILIQIVGFGSQFIVAWLLTPEQLGEIKIMQTYLSIALLFTTFGFTTSVLKLCSENRLDGEKLFIYKKAIKYVGLTLLITWPLLLFISESGFVSKDKEIIRLFPYFSLSLIPLTYTGIFANYLQAIKEIILLSKIQSLTKIVSVGAIIILTYFFRFNGYILASIISFFITYIFLKYSIDKVNKPFSLILIEKPFKTHWNYSSISFLTLVVGQVATFADIFLMNYFIMDRVLIGYYSFALTLTMINYIFTNTVQQIVVPHLSEKSSNKNELNKILKKYENINLVVSIIISVVLSIIVPFSINLLFGLKYIQSIPFFFVLLIAWLFQNSVTFKGYALLGTGKISFNLIISSINLFVGFSVSYLFMTKYGIMGLAYGKLLTNFISIFTVGIFFKIGMRSYVNENAR